MDQGKIQETLELKGDARGAVGAIRQTTDEMKKGERQASSFASKLAGLSNRVGSFLGGIGKTSTKVFGIMTGGALLASKGLSGLGLAGGAAAGALSGIGVAAGLAAAGVGVLIAKMLQLASVSDQAKQLNRTWTQVKATLSAPFVHFLANAFAILNATMKDPAVVWLIRQFALMAAVILQSLLPAVYALAGAITAFAHALMEGDFANIFTRTWQGFVDGWKSAGKAAGAAAGATFGEAYAEEAAKAAASANQGGGPLRGGVLKNIGDIGTGILNALLSGFKRADFSVLNQAADAIRQRLDTLFKKGEISEISIVPRIVLAQTAVAEALQQANTVGRVNQQIIDNVRAKLAGLGPAVQDYVENLLRAKDATLAVEAATSDLEAAQGRLKSAQSDLTAAAERRAAAEADLLPASDELRTLQIQLLELEQAQVNRREQLVQLAEDEEAAQAELVRLQAAQEAALARLAPLRQAVADAAEEQYQAELKVRDAQDALIPLQARLAEAQAAAASVQATIAEAQRLRNEEIEDATRVQAAAVRALEEALKHVGDQYQDDIDRQNKLIAAVDERWKAEIDGATEAYRLAKKTFDIEDERQKRANLNFTRQRAAAQNIADPNERIAALARIDRAAAMFEDRNADALKAAQLEAELTEKSLAQKTADREAEKVEAQANIVRLNALIEAERAIIQERLNSVREEGEARLAAMREQSDLLARDEAAQVRAAEATVAAAQAEVERQQTAINTLAAEVETARRKEESAARELASREAAVHAETDGAIASAKTRLDGITDAKNTLEDQLDDESRALEQMIARRQADLDLRGQKLALQADIEERPIAARAAAAEKDVAIAQAVADQSQTTLDNYVKAGELANDRLITEGKIADLISQQRDLLQTIADQQAAAARDAAAGGAGPGFGGAGDLLKNLPAQFTEEELAAFRQKVLKFVQTAVDLLKEKWGEVDWGKLGEDLWTKVDLWLKDHKIKILDYLDFGDIGNFILENLDTAAWVGAGAKLGSLLLQGIKTFGGGATGGGAVGGGALEGALGGAATSAAASPVVVAGFTALGLVLGTVAVAGIFEGLRAVGVENPAWETTRNLIKIGFETQIPEGIREGMESFVKRDFVLGIDGKVGAVIQTELDNLGKPHYFVFDTNGNLVQELMRPFNLSVDQLLDPQTGLVQKYTNGLSSDVKNFTFDKEGNITSQINKPFADANIATVGPDGSITLMWDKIKGGADSFLTDFKAKHPELTQQLIHPFEDAADQIVGHSIIPQMFADILSAAGTFKTNVETYGTGANGLKDKLIAPYDLAKNTIVGAGTSPTEASIMGGLIGSVTSGLDSLRTLTVGEGGTIPEMTGTLANLFTAARSAIGDPTTGTVSGLKGDVSARLGEMKTDADTKSQEIKSALTTQFEGAKTDSTASIDTLKTNLTNTLTSIPGVIGPLLTAVAGAFNYVFGPKESPGTILYAMTNGDAPGGAEHGGFFPRLEFATRKALDYQRIEVWLGSFSALFGALKSYFDPAGKDAVALIAWITSLGQKIGEAIATGIRSQIQGAYDAGKAIVDAAKDGADDAAGNPDSPAPAFIPLGTYIPMGLIAGMLKLTAQVADAGRRLITTASAAMTGTPLAGIKIAGLLNPSLSMLPGGGPGQSGSALMRGSTFNAYNVNLYAENAGANFQEQSWWKLITRR